MQLAENWRACSTSPGWFSGPGELRAAELPWLSATVPSTAASTLRAHSLWSVQSPARRFDSEDWWYCTSFRSEGLAVDSDPKLVFEGLATLADVWLNGELILTTANMFVSSECSVGPLLRNENELVIRFRALDDELKRKRPRPRWRAPMIESQQLRWTRTTLLGRTPGWSPPCAAVGPWRPLWFQTAPHLVTDIVLSSHVVGGKGVVKVACNANTARVESIGVKVIGHGTEKSLLLSRSGAGRWEATLAIDDPELWWPHTHGEPALYRAALEVRTSSGEYSQHSIGNVGFRTVVIESNGSDFAIVVNGVSVFCRGACWMPLDPVTLTGLTEDYELCCAQVAATGMNMIRVSGATVYEADKFYDQCDQMGLLVWQDFMFANMDYPEADQTFISTVELESRQILNRLAHRPCIAVWCGNSEVEQQAAMWGAPRECWTSGLFHSTLPRLVAELGGGVPYWPSSAHGGAFPHQPNAGTTSYYGVGAYLRPLTDARESGVKFATECLAFANIPEDESLDRISQTSPLRVHSPLWKQRSPRDAGAGWDFDDVRDSYVARIFGIDPFSVRYADHGRYLVLGRIATSIAMQSVFMEWRSAQSPCTGALIWFLRDLWLGAGWGILSAEGSLKAPAYLLRRVLQPVAISISDEGCNGLCIRLINERPTPLSAKIELVSVAAGGSVRFEGAREVTIPVRGNLELSAGEIIGAYGDHSYAYRFGPPPYQVLAARLWSDSRDLLSETHYFPLGFSANRDADIGLTALARPTKEGNFDLTVSSSRTAQFVTVHCPGYESSDNYFHVLPDAPQSVVLTRTHGTAHAVYGRVQALNAVCVGTIEIVQ